VIYAVFMGNKVKTFLHLNKYLKDFKSTCENKMIIKILLLLILKLFAYYQSKVG